MRGDKRDIRELLATPALVERFARTEPTFGQLLGALREFGEPLFFMRGGRSFCAVTLAGIHGPENLTVAVARPASPASAGLALLLGLLERSRREAADGIEALQAHLAGR